MYKKLICVFTALFISLSFMLSSTTSIKAINTASVGRVVSKKASKKKAKKKKSTKKSKKSSKKSTKKTTKKSSKTKYKTIKVRKRVKVKKRYKKNGKWKTKCVWVWKTVTQKVKVNSSTPAVQNTPAPAVPAAKPVTTPVVTGTYQQHGPLHISGNQIYDQHNNAFVLKGASTHGLSWYPGYVNQNAFRTLKSWGANTVRLALYTDEYNGYLSGGNQGNLEALIDKGVQAATNEGLYVIIDWHVLNNANVFDAGRTNAAKTFFSKISSKYRNYGNVLYEICNEPNNGNGGSSWSTIRNYANSVVPVIRSNCNNLIIVGTPNWCQYVDEAVNSPVSGTNIAYSFHYYASTHKLDGEVWRNGHKSTYRSMIDNARSHNLCVFISEYSICDASGNGNVDLTSANKWASYVDSNHMSYIQWSLSNKNESASLIKSNVSKTSDWSYNELTTTGQFFYNRMH